MLEDLRTRSRAQLVEYKATPHRIVVEYDSSAVAKIDHVALHALAQDVLSLPGGPTILR